jgi:hypothetical protein
VLAAAMHAAVALGGQPGEPAWRRFEGTWSATGQRQALPTGTGHDASTVQLSGAVVLTSAEGLGRGFRGEAVGFDEGRGRSVARWVWTDEHGDRIFGSAEGESVATGRRFTATITGGTGRYTGITGDFTCTWQYVVAADGTLQARGTALSGRYALSAVRR